MAGIEDYLSGLFQAITGNASTQPASQPQQISNLASAGFPGAQQMQAAAPQQNGLTSFLGNPLTQAALQGYFSAAGSPRLAGWGGRISSGGLGALSGFNAAESNQLKTQQEQLELQKAQAEAAQTAQQQKVFGGLTPQQQQVATYPGLATFQDKAAIQLNNKNAVAAFQAQYPNDPKAAAFSSSYVDSPKAVSPGDIDADYQAHLQGPGKLKAQTADLANKQAETKRDLAAAQRLQNQPAAGTAANWYNPTTKQYYRGAQKAPTDIPASVAASSRSDQEVRARAAAYQKAYSEAAKNYIATKTTTQTHLMGPATETPPSEADVDAYAREQAEQQVNALFGSTGTAASAAASGAASADEPSSTTDESDPLSLIPAGKVPAMNGDVHGYSNPDGSGFVSVE